MFDKVVARLVDLEDEVVEVGAGGNHLHERRGDRHEDFLGFGGAGLSLKDREAAEDVEAELVGIAPLDLVGERKLVVEGKIASNGVSTGVEDPSDEGGGPLARAWELVSWDLTL